MNRNIILILFLLLLYPVLSFCQAPDSLIFDTVYVEYDTTQWQFVYLDIYMVTMDTVYMDFFGLIVYWSSVDGMIWPGASIFWRDPFYEWDEIWDSLFFDEDSLMLFAWCDIGGDPNQCFVFTDSLRLNIIDLRFGISPEAQPQFCEVGGYLLYPPDLVVIPGGIVYGNPTDINEGEFQLPLSFNLYQNYPNPFNANTLIRYNLSQSCFIRLEIYDILGMRVRTLIENYQQAGTHHVIWDGKTENGDNVISGIYFYRLTSGYYKDTKKMVLVR